MQRVLWILGSAVLISAAVAAQENPPGGALPHVRVRSYVQDQLTGDARVLVRHGAYPTLYPAPAAASDDAALFGAVVESLRDFTGRPVRVDPRPLRGDSRVLEPSAGDLAGDTAGILQARADVLTRMGIPRTDAVADLACAIGNMRVADPAVPADTLGRSACIEQGRISSVIATLSWDGVPARFHAKSLEGARGTQLRTMRVFQISTDPRLGSYTVYDYVFARSGEAHPWELLGREVVLSAG
jgi:hypothetical protein